MKKFFKGALVACSVLSLTASVGALAACNPDGEGGHTHSYTEWCKDDWQHWKKCAEDDATDAKSDHSFSKGVCECGATRTSVEVTAGDTAESGVNADVDVSKKSLYCFVGAMGAYEFTVNAEAGNSYTFDLGGTSYTVDDTHKTFMYVVGKGVEVKVHNPAAERVEDKEKTKSGVELVITPAEGNTQEKVNITIVSKSQIFYKGDNTLEVKSEVYDTFLVSGGENYTFIFELAKDTDVYTVEYCGKTLTVDKDHKTHEIELDSDYAQEGFQSYSYMFKITPAAGASDELGVFALAPKAAYSFGGEISISYVANEEVHKFDNDEYVAKINLPSGLDAGNYELRGTVSYSDLTVKCTALGLDERVSCGADAKKDFKYPVTISANDITTGYVEVTFGFGTDSEFILSAVLGEVTETADNHILSLVGDKLGSGVTVCSADDADNNGKYIYTFTAPKDGWYAVNVLADSAKSGLKYFVKYGTETLSGTTAADWAVEAVQLTTGATLTVELEEGVGVLPAGAKIAVTETTEPAGDITEMVVGSNQITLTEAQIADGGIELTFTASAGNYTVTLSGSDWENAVVFVDGSFVAGFDPDDFDQWDAIQSGNFTVTGSSVTFKLSGLMEQNSEYTVTIAAA